MNGERHPVVRLGYLAVLLVACSDEVAYVPPPSSPAVVQNNHYTTNIYNTPTPTPTPTLTPNPTPPPAPTTPSGVAILVPPRPEVLGRDVKPVGVASCDAYLTHVEVCSQRMLARLPGQGDALTRIALSLDMTRRAWRNAIPEMTPRARASLAETCSDSLRLYDMSAASSCHE
jgi:hypothetical protein